MDGVRDSDGGRLHSWKQIALFFGRDVRTVQRWEREEGLPVHRRAAGGRGRVWAHRTELQAWWLQSGNAPAFGPDGLPTAAPGGLPAFPEPGGSYRRRALLAAAAVIVFLISDGRPPQPGPDGAGHLIVDVRPFSHPNVAVPGGVLAVAVTAPARLLADLDPSTMRAGGTAPSATRWQDFDGDGRLELWMYFDVSALALNPGASRLEIAGRTRDGRVVAGGDDVITLAGAHDSIATVADRQASFGDQ